MFSLGIDCVGTGSYSVGSASYTDSEASSWQDNVPVGEIAITNLAPPGAAISGTFSVEMGTGFPVGDAGPGTLTLSGSFHVCHRPDTIAQ
jgi:hypothetical protein